jgi:hypothetical protein
VLETRAPLGNVRLGGKTDIDLTCSDVRF